MRLDPLSLKLFVSVVERDSIAAAAEQGHIAPAAVSKRLSELEATLRTPLLNRTNKGAQATPAGMALLHLARRLLIDLDDIAVQMRDWSGGTRGQVRVFANFGDHAVLAERDCRAPGLTEFDDEIRRFSRVSSSSIVSDPPRLVAQQALVDPYAHVPTMHR